jgi:carboxyl-terminal processing protease
MKNNKVQVALPLFFSIAVIVGMLIGYKLHSNMPNAKSFFQFSGNNKLEEVMNIIENRYVDKVNIDSVSEDAIAELLNKLDPHSVYIPPVNLKEVNEDLVGEFGGIGVQFNVFDDTVHILAVLNGGPAEKAGLKIGDMILAVGDSTATGLNQSVKFKNWVKGPTGSEVTLKIKREQSILIKKIQRGTIPLTSIDAVYMLDGETGLIRLNRFSENTYEEFMQSLEKLKKSGMQKLILDLRDNGGGILGEAVDIADEFIEGNDLIVYTEGKNNPKREYFSKRPGLFEKGKLIVLLNESSASASEVVAGALQDLDRAMIVGRRSFGKGLVQEQYSLSDGSALRLTVARYFTPLGRSIQKPYGNGNEEYKKEILNRLMNPENQRKDSAASTNSKKYKTSSGKVLFGGGGITPDVFIGIDSIFYDTSLNKFYINNAIGNFSYKYYVKNKTLLAKFKDASEFSNKFEPENSVIQEFMAFSEKEGIIPYKLNKEELLFLKTRIKALISRILWGETGYHMVLNAKDPTILKSKELMKQQ